MAGDWIKMRSNIKDDPDVVVMAGILKIDEFATVGRLHAVWAWLDQHSKNGTNVRITGGYLDRLTACAGFADAMRAVDWLRGDDGDLEFPNFDRHNGDSAKRRCQDSKRKNNARSIADKAEDCPQDVQLNADICPEFSGLEKRREEKRRDNTKDVGETECAADTAPTTISPQTDDEWLSGLSANTAYEGIDVRREFAKCAAWCTTNRKKASRRRFINWLNRCEKPMVASGSGGLEERFRKW